jgi:glycosyltransferase involved in cell wall biosynthesis
LDIFDRRALLVGDRRLRGCGRSGAVRLRVGANLLYLKPGLVGGSEVYVQRLLRALGTEAADDLELTLFVNRRFREAHADLAANHPTVVAPISGDSPPIRIGVESTWLARETSRRPLHLVHHLANTIPQLRTRPAVVTIHDLLAIVRPQDVGRIKGVYLRRRLRPAARRARVVTTPSEFTRGLLIDRFELDASRVVVVPPPLFPRETGTIAGGADTRGIEEPFFLYPAITHPHKNHITLLRAFARVADAHPRASLVFAGGQGAAEDAVRDEVGRLGLADRVHRLGRIPRVDLDMLFRRAVALTFPSRHEGYGLPLAEAMAIGCPVIASGTTASPEVVGDAGILLDPDDFDGWTDAMVRMLHDDEFRRGSIAAGRERVRSLSPAETARRQMDAYRRALELD